MVFHIFMVITILMFYMVFGYAQAEDHLEDIVKNFLLAEGRMSEFLGESYINNDFMVRMIGIPELAEKYVKNMNRHLYLMLDAFCRGINRYIDTHNVLGWIRDYHITVKSVIVFG